jgi:type III pantothenate kinase
MVNLVIDIGNTLTKVAVFADRKLTDLQVFENFDVNELEGFFIRDAIDQAIISSVDKEISDMEYVIQAKCKYVRFSTSIRSNVINHYKTPETLGVDRLAAVIGAAAVSPGKNNLVIDAGTCITYDFIDSQRNYYGGSICPGISMRLQSLNTFTERLPLIMPDFSFTAPSGTDTRSSILSGVQNGVFHETLGFANSYVLQYPDLQIILCGGDVNFFDSKLKSSIFAHAVKTEPDLVLIGLNEVIYQQND